MDFKTLPEILIERSRGQYDDIVYRYLTYNNSNEDLALTFGELHRKANIIANKLLECVQPGDRVLLLYPSGLDFIETFFGCLLAGIIAVPVDPPRENHKMNQLVSIMKDCGSKLMLTNSSISKAVEQNLSDINNLPNIQILETDCLEANNCKEIIPCPEKDDIAFLQYTSGSTGLPKGVMVSHGNIINNSIILRETGNTSKETIGVHWLPMFHDMGLIGSVIHAVFVGFQSILMSPVDFLQKPFRWLKAMSDYKGTITGGPNFAFDLCSQSITDEQMSTINLEPWKIAYSGAEMIRAKTLNTFAAKFKKCGFNKKAFLPSYGLAETTLFMTSAIRGKMFNTVTLDTNYLHKNKAKKADEKTQNTTVHVSCGIPSSDHILEIVDPDTRKKCKNGKIGEIWVSGPSITKGYWGKKDSDKIFKASIAEDDNNETKYLRTGDMGFQYRNELYITGRLKEMIIIRGGNYFPQDIEKVVESSHPSIQENAVAAFSVEKNNSEHLVIAQELKKTAIQDFNAIEIIKNIKKAVSESFGLQVSDIILLGPLKIPRTSSNKIQRRLCHQLYLENKLDYMFKESDTSRESKESIDDLRNPNDNNRVGIEEQKGKEQIIDLLVDSLSDILNEPKNEIDIHDTFTSFGLDSLQAVQLSGNIQDELGVELSDTVIYDYPTIDRLASFITDLLDGKEEEIKEEETKEKPESARYNNEPIAIIGMECEFPGAENVNEFWDLLINGKDGITEVPANRFDIDKYYSKEIKPGHINSRHGGFISNIENFDAQFFSIAPPEAENIDPQQRKLLEISYKALQSAGITLGEISGSDTGVFVGISSSEYGDSMSANLEEANVYMSTGNSLSVSANRLSYFYNLHGPSFSIDSACSSSLTAVHMACQELMANNCGMAIVGASNLILSPKISIGFSQAKLLSPEGRCKTFDDAANGYVRSEGCGVLILKPLCKAQMAGDNILAVIEGSTCAQDGKSNGLMAPNSIAQQTLLRKALLEAGLQPDSISFIETHGTGTELGDPIEVNSIYEVYGKKRSKDLPPLILGGVKANIGHLEASAGMAGIIKTILCLNNRKIPPQIHFNKPNTHLEWDKMPFTIPKKPLDISKLSDNNPIRASVSSFGFGGSIANIILAEPPVPVDKARQTNNLPNVLCFSAKTGESLNALANKYSKYLEETSEPLDTICYNANVYKDHFPYRKSFVANTKEELIQMINTGLSDTGSKPKKRKTAFLFAGAGPQYHGMAKELYLINDVFTSALDECSQYFEKHFKYSIKDILWGKDLDIIHNTQYTQPALFSLEVAMAKLLMNLGIKPDYLMGHSFGEYAVACIAGIISIEDGVRLIGTRAKLMGEVTEEGGMLAIFANEKTILPYIANYSQTVSVAAINTHSSVTLSGKKKHIEQLQSILEADGYETILLNVSIPSHSPLMEPILPEFRKVVETIDYNKPQIPIVSTLSGQLAGNEMMNPEYWVQHIANPVRFFDGICTLINEGTAIFMETGPGSSLLGMVTQEIDGDEVLLSTIKKDEPQPGYFFSSIASIYEAGASIDWNNFYGNSKYEKILLPTYSFEAKKYWKHVINKENNQGKKTGINRQGFSGENDGIAYLLEKFNDFKKFTIGELEDIESSLAKINGHSHSSNPKNNIQPDKPGIAIEKNSIKILNEVKNENNTEKKLALITEYLKDKVSDVLKVEKHNIEEDISLMTMGLDSLMATQIVSKLRKELEVEITLKSVFKEPTLKALAQIIIKSFNNQVDKSVQTDYIPQNMHLSAAQERMWFLHEFSDDSSAYNVPGLVRMQGELNKEKLEQSFQHIISRHQTLRSNFLNESGKPKLVIHDSIHWKLDFIDLPPNTDNVEEKALQLINDDIKVCFDLTKDALIKATIYKIKPNEYILFVKMHHIISDGWSVGVLIDEIAKVYSGLLENDVPALPPLELQYIDYVNWQRKFLQEEIINKQGAYWKEKLVNNQVLKLSMNGKRNGAIENKGHKIEFEFTREVTEKLKTFSTNYDVTLFMTMLSAFKILLYKYTNQKNISVGSPVANRLRAEYEPLIGLFINTLVLNSEVDENDSFTDFLSDIKKTTLDAYENQDIPFEKVVDIVQPDRNINHTPLFQVLFVLQNSPKGNLELPGLTLSKLTTPVHSVKFDLFLELTEENNTLQGKIDYKTSLFEKRTINKMIQHFKTLIGTIIDNPNKKIIDLDILSAQEKHLLLDEWNNTKVPYPMDKCIHHLFEEQVNIFPEKCAIVCQGTTLSYKELNNKANQLGHYLKSHGTKTGDIVGILMEQSESMIITMLGILKTGAAYLPMDPNFPDDRLLHMVNDSKCSLVLTHKALKGRLSGDQGVRVIYTDHELFSSEISKEPANNLNVPVDPNNPLYVIFTSGSTGKPKGCQITHKQLNNYCHAIIDRFGFKPEWRFAYLNQFSTDLGNTILFPPLILGSEIHIVEKNLFFDNLGLEAYIKENKIDCFKITPSHLYGLIGNDTKSGVLPQKCLILGGEACDLPWLRQIIKNNKNCRVYNHYGPTETTIGALTFDTRKLTGDMTKLPIGKPLANNKAYILDPGLKLKAIGIPGELYIGGAQVSPGYLNRNKLTEEKFIKSPFEQDSGTRLYKTGDLARYLPDGNIEFLGRMDNQLKIRGFRIELGEIEAALNNQESVGTSAVLAKDSKSGNKRLVAYIVFAENNKEQDFEAIRKGLAKTLPDYMVPSLFIKLEKMPLTPNGKIDRKSLPEPEGNIEATQEYVAPQTEAQKKLADIWQEVLGLERVGIHDNFFELGGHSLLSMRLIDRINSTFSIKLPVSSLFNNPTIHDISKEVTKETVLHESLLVPIQKNGELKPIFFAPGSPGYASSFQLLSNYLGDTQPIYGLEYAGMINEMEVVPSVEEIAGQCIVALKRQQPEGPYILCGHSFGGWVAFEMAIQLINKGEEILSLIILDKNSPDKQIYKTNNTYDELYNITMAMEDYFGIKIGASSEDVKYMGEKGVYEAIQNKLKALNRIEKSVSYEDFNKIIKKVKIISQIKYNPLQKLYTMPIILYPSKDNRETEVKGGWNNYSNDVKLEIASGGHLSMLKEPYVQELSHRIREQALAWNNKVFIEEAKSIPN